MPNQVDKQRAQAEEEAVNRTLTMSRSDSRWSGDRSGGFLWERPADDFSVAGGSTPRSPSNFSDINKSGPAVAGPSNFWVGKKDAA